MADTVIRNEEGKFWGLFSQWVAEYPDAMLFENAQKAGKYIGAWDLKEAVEIIEHYGFEDEKLYSLTIQIEPDSGAYERAMDRYYGSDTPVTQEEQYRAAWEAKRKM